MDNLPEPTQGSRSRVTYSSVILFMYSVEAEFPFSSVNLNNLNDTNFPFYLVDGSLDDKSRVVPFKMFSEQTFCLFSKVQKGKKK